MVECRYQRRGQGTRTGVDMNTFWYLRGQKVRKRLGGSTDHSEAILQFGGDVGKDHDRVMI